MSGSRLPSTTSSLLEPSSARLQASSSTTESRGPRQDAEPRRNACPVEGPSSDYSNDIEKLEKEVKEQKELIKTIMISNNGNRMMGNCRMLLNLKKMIMEIIEREDDMDSFLSDIFEEMIKIIRVHNPSFEGSF